MVTRIYRDIAGATAVEFGFTAAAFFAVIFGIINGGLLLWTQIGLQHGAEMAARCAGIQGSTSANCPPNNTPIGTYAAQQAYGLPNVNSANFTVSAGGCGAGSGYVVTANYTTTYWGTPRLALTAQACFPS